MTDEVRPYTREELDGLAALETVDELWIRRLLATARAGLADRERLDWMEVGNSHVWKAVDEEVRVFDSTDRVIGKGADFRAAIDAARGVHPAGTASENAGASSVPSDADFDVLIEDYGLADAQYEIGWRNLEMPDVERQKLRATRDAKREALRTAIAQLRGAPATRQEVSPSVVHTPAPTERQPMLDSAGKIWRCAGCGQPTDNALDVHIGCCRACYEIRRVHWNLTQLVTGDAEKDLRVVDAFEREHGDVLRGLGFKIEESRTPDETASDPAAPVPASDRLNLLTEIHEFYEFAATDEEHFDSWLHEKIIVERQRLGLPVAEESPTPAPTEDAKDAARWRFILPFLYVDGDDSSSEGYGKHYEYLCVRETPLLDATSQVSFGEAAPGIVDAAIKRALSAQQHHREEGTHLGERE